MFLPHWILLENPFNVRRRLSVASEKYNHGAGPVDADTRKTFHISSRFAPTAEVDRLENHWAHAVHRKLLNLAFANSVIRHQNCFRFLGLPCNASHRSLSVENTKILVAEVNMNCLLLVYHKPFN